MKKTVLLTLSLVVLLPVLSSFLSLSPRSSGREDVQEVLKSHCYGCHSDEASGKIAKSNLNFNKWEEYRLTKKISKLSDICDEVQQGKMPPKKFLKSNPDKALSDKQKEMICKWTESESAKLMEEMQ